MPILRFRDRVFLFVHIPKCGGVSIERYCFESGIKIAFLDNAYFSLPAPQRWNVSSPQHVDGYSLARMFRADFFDGCFAMVRDPADRLRSAFAFQKNVERKIPPQMTLDAFVRERLPDAACKIGAYDNHFLPQTHFIPPNFPFYIFKLEAGMTAIKRHIDQAVFGADVARQIGHFNKSVQKGESDQEEYFLGREATSMVAEIYKDDFQKFGYPSIVRPRAGA
ncbi:sulfotransferase family 2 domain-containing protein [Martelella sp. FLE1502]